MLSTVDQNYVSFRRKFWWINGLIVGSDGITSATYFGNSAHSASLLMATVMRRRKSLAYPGSS